MTSSGMYALFRLMGIGWYVALCIGGGALGGMFLDGIFGSKPALTLLGLGLGLVLAFWGMYRMLVDVRGRGSNCCHERDA